MDALRAVAAGAVVLGHTRDLLLQDYRPGSDFLTAVFYGISGLGHEAVILFFVLSGYWIAKTAHRRPVEGFWSGYLIDRLSRLWVVILPALALTMLMDAIGLAIGAPVYSGLTGAHTAQSVQFNPIEYVGTAMFLQSLAVDPAGTNDPLWSVAFEFWFYIWFAALWLAIRHRKPTIALASLGLVVAYPGLLVGFASWLLGAGLYGVTQGRLARPAAVLALVFGMALSGAAVVMKLHDIALATGVAASLYGALGLRIGLPRWLGGLASYGANASFSLYAIHMPIVVLASTAFVWNERLDPTADAIAWVSAIVGITIVVAAGFARVTEAQTARVRNWLRSIFARPRAA